MADRADAAPAEKPRLQLAWGLGLRPDVVNCVVSLNDATVLYPQGRALAVHNLETNEMSFMSGGPRSGIPIAVALAPSRKYVVVCEEEVGDSPPGVGFYNLLTSHRLRTLTCADAGSSRFVCAAFSPDSKQLAAASAAPSFMLVLWSVEKGRVLATVKQPGLHTRVSYVPGEAKHTTLCASGARSLRLWGLVDETQLKETVVSIGKRIADEPDYNDHCWIRASPKTGGARSGAAGGGAGGAAAGGSQGAAACSLAGSTVGHTAASAAGCAGSSAAGGAAAAATGEAASGPADGTSGDVSRDASPPTLCAVTASGVVHFFSGGSELRQSVTLARAEWDDPSRPPPQALRVRACARGVLVSGADGLFALLEHQADGAYVQTRTFTCSPPRATGGGVGVRTVPGTEAETGGKRTGRRETTDIVSMCMGRAQESVLVATACGQLGMFPLSAIELLNNGSSPFSFSGTGLVGAHRGPIQGLQSCAAKPVLATCGADRTVRIWDYGNRACLLVKQVAEDPLCLSLHPSGDLVVVGFADKLRLYSVLLDDLRLVAAFAAKGVREVCFSHGGGTIAAVTGSHIHLFDAFSHAALGLLRGHTGLVWRVAWSADDVSLVSCGHDGAIYLWDVATRQRVVQSGHVCKAEQYEAVVVAPTTREGGIPLVAGAHTGVLRGLMVGGPVGVGADGGVRAHGGAEVGSRPRALCLSHSDRILFAGTDDGGLRGYAWPLGADGGGGGDVAVPPAWASVHGGAVSRLALSHDETVLFSASEDGQLFVWEMVGGAAVAAVAAVPAWRREAKLLDALDTVLVSRSAMRDKATAFAELSDKLERVSAQAEYQVHVREQVFAQERRQMQAGADAAMAEVEAQVEKLRQELAAHQSLAASAAAVTEGEHMRAAEELEHLYERKLAAEAGRYEALRRQADDTSAAFERQLHAVHAAGRATEERLVAELAAAHADGEKRTRAAQREAEAMRARYEETLLQEEEYGEAATVQAVRDKAASIEAERDVQRQMRGDVAVLRWKIESVTAEAEHARQQLGVREEQLAAAQHERAEADRTIHLLRRELTERAAKIGALERRMTEIKAANKELDKFKYVLDYKLREMRREAEPKEEAMGEMRDTIRQLDAEIQREYSSTLELEASVTEKATQVEAMQAEVRAVRTELAQRDQLLASFGRQLHAIVSSDSSHWREGTMELHREFCVKRQEEGARASKLEDDAVAAEHARQRMYMERALDSVKTRVGRTESQARIDLHKKLAENQVLLSEVNSLRYEAKALRRKIDQLTQLKSVPALTAGGVSSPVSPAAAPHTRPGTAASCGSLGRPSSVLTLVLPSTPSTGLPRSASAATLRRPASAAQVPGRAAGVLLGGSGRPITPSPSRGQLVKGRLSAAPEKQQRAHESPPPPATGHRWLGADVSKLREQVCTMLESERH